MEVKSVTLVEEGMASFPDAPTERGARHVLALARAKKQGLRAVVLFVIQRDDASGFTPHDRTDRVFGEALRRAAAGGVEVYAWHCRVGEDEIKITGEVPVYL